ncbi:hypothetical protein sos41_10170 [Alphaproteobacteria bacterium SO-S41]|nr:hypothetical protein sos41_10170 [Alphaproteobacteria bacterium SO-S41]
MTVRTAFIAAAALAGGIGIFHAIADVPTTPVAPGGVAVEVSTVPVELRSADPTDLRIGKLIYRGGISVVPRSDHFGGLSALKVSADGSRFVSVEDVGIWVTGALTYDENGNLAGMNDVRIAQMLDENGAQLSGKVEGDSEGLAFADPHDLKGDAFVSYENHHRVLRFDFAKDGVAAKGQAFAMPDAIKTLRSNEGLEVLATLDDGRLLAISEYGPRDDDQDSLGWAVDPKTGAATSFIVKRVLPYAMTDAALLPDGRVLTLERRFSTLTGPGAELRVFDPATFMEGATVEGTLIAELFAGVTVDNMEGVAARKTADGKTMIYIVSDDNFQRPLQRTLVMMFELAE